MRLCLRVRCDYLLALWADDDLESLAISSLADPDADRPRTIVNGRNAVLALSADRDVHASLLVVHALDVVANLKVASVLAGHVQVAVLVVGQRLVRARLGRAKVEDLILLGRLRRDREAARLYDVRRVAVLVVRVAELAGACWQVLEDGCDRRLGYRAAKADLDHGRTLE